MKITYAPRGILQINDARIIHRNFTGEASKYNREGDRNFSLKIPTEDIAQELVDLGWNVKIKEPREEGETPLMYLPVKVKFNERGPVAWLVTGDKVNQIPEDMIHCFDEIDIASVDLDIRPYEWSVSGKTGITAYLHAIRVYQDLDRFSAEYNSGIDGIE